MGQGKEHRTSQFQMGMNPSTLDRFHFGRVHISRSKVVLSIRVLVCISLPFHDLCGMTSHLSSTFVQLPCNQIYTLDNRVHLIFLYQEGSDQVVFQLRDPSTSASKTLRLYRLLRILLLLRK